MERFIVFVLTQDSFLIGGTGFEGFDWLNQIPIFRNT